MRRKEILLGAGIILIVILLFFLLLPWAQKRNEEKHSSGQEETREEESSRTGALSGMVICLDPGHGGMDPGKVGENGALEKDINLAVALETGSLLSEAGAEVIYTRTKDMGLYEDSDRIKKNADLRRRCALMEEKQADLALSIHQNSYESSEIWGAQVFYYAASGEGRRLALCLQESLKNHLNPQNKRKAKENSSYYLLSHSPCPTVIVECGYLSNREEAALLADGAYQKKIAQAILQGVVAYVNETEESLAAQEKTGL